MESSIKIKLKFEAVYGFVFRTNTRQVRVNSIKTRSLLIAQCQDGHFFSRVVRRQVEILYYYIEQLKSHFIVSRGKVFEKKKTTIAELHFRKITIARPQVPYTLLFVKNGLATSGKRR